MLLGSSIFVSAFVVKIRSRAFELKFKEVLEEEKSKRDRRKTSAPKFLLLPFSRRNSVARPTENLPETRSEPRLRQRETSIVPLEVLDTPKEAGGGESNGNGNIERGQAGQSEINVALDTTTHQPHPKAIQTISPSTNNHTETKLTTSINNNALVPSLGGIVLQPQGKPSRPSLFSPQGVGARFAHFHLPQIHQSAEELVLSSSSYARNSELAHVSHLERLRLGGVEYRATRFLVWLVPAYFILWQLFGCIGLGAWITINSPSVARSNGLNAFWAGAFNGVSAFNNNGYSLIDANMTAFQTSNYMLITMALMILAGNTCYPIFLRLIVWGFLKLTPEGWVDEKESLKFLLNHPRRCYTNLFSSNDTWWLLAAVITLNGIDWTGFLVLNVNPHLPWSVPRKEVSLALSWYYLRKLTAFKIGNHALEYLPLHSRVIDGLFQATAVRSGGFYVVGIASLRIGTQFLYTVMMYISAFPVALTIRSTNVYEERSLGIYAKDINRNDDTEAIGFWSGLRRRVSVLERKGSKNYFFIQQLRAQLAHDLWWLALAILLILIVESAQFENNPATFSVFNVVFEVVSGYGCVGISVGVPRDQYSFCGSWHKLSKLILCAVMLRGRHRGLPILLDMAVLLPGERLDRAEEEDARIRLESTESRAVEV